MVVLRRRPSPSIISTQLADFRDLFPEISGQRGCERRDSPAKTATTADDGEDDPWIPRLKPTDICPSLPP